MILQTSEKKHWSKSTLHPVFLLATWFYTGLIPKAPGTMGSLATLPCVWLLIDWGGIFSLLLAIAVIFGLGLWAAGLYMADTGRPDPGEVVIDEVAGQGIACLPIAFFNATGALSVGPFVLAFVAFRILDIYKPWPIRFFDRRHDAYGLMMDDVAAGLGAAFIVTGFYLYVLP